MSKRKNFFIGTVLVATCLFIIITTRQLFSQVAILNSELYTPIFQESDLLEFNQPNQTPFGLSKTSPKLKLNDESRNKLTSINNPFVDCQKPKDNVVCSEKWKDNDDARLCVVLSKLKDGKNISSEQLCLSKNKPIAYYEYTSY